MNKVSAPRTIRERKKGVRQTTRGMNKVASWIRGVFRGRTARTARTARIRRVRGPMRKDPRELTTCLEKAYRAGPSQLAEEFRSIGRQGQP